MDNGRSQDIERDADPDAEEEEVDDVDKDDDDDEEDVDGDDNEEDEDEEENEDREEEEEEEDTNTPWSYPDSDDNDLRGISLNRLKEEFELLAASLVAMEENEVELQEKVWESMAEGILWNILVLLPVATQCRFRCVSSRWKIFLSEPRSTARRQVGQVEARPLCTIMSETESSESWSYSHMENKWYRIPFRPESCVDMEWRLVAADGGLLCYQSPFGRPKWLLVCNPRTGAFQIVPPCRLELGTGFLLAHFVVDKELHSFTIVTMWYQEIMYFYSKTRLWNSCSRSGPGFHVKDNDLVRENIIYSQFQQFDWHQGCGSKTENYKTIEANLPCDARKPYHIICSKGHVMLVQFRPRENDLIQIWKLVTEDAAALWLSRWEEVTMEVPVSMGPLVDQIQGCWSHGNQFICLRRAGHIIG